MKIVRVLFVILGFALTVPAAPSVPRTISIPEAPSVSGSGDSLQPVLSANGRYVVFLSSARNLIGNADLAPHLHLFRHDLITGDTILIAAGTNTHLRAPSISSNAQTIAFADGTHVYSVDTNSLVPSLVSVDRDGNPPPNPLGTRNRPLSDKPQISADGRWIAFESFATNLTSETDLNNETDVFLRDTWSNRTVLISIARQGGTTGNKKSELIDITPDGNYVLFTSTGSDFATNNPTYGFLELYVRDVAVGITTVVSNSVPQSPYEVRSGSISDDGRYVLYKLEFPWQMTAFTRLYDRLTRSNFLVNAFSANSLMGYPVCMTADARFIAYDQSSGLFLWDRQSNTRTRASGVSQSRPFVSEVSADGSTITFSIDDSTSIYQAYYRQMSTNQPRSLTQTLAGPPSAKDHRSSSIALGPAGEFIVFESPEDNLVPNDRNLASDIFVHFVATGETRLISRAHQDAPAFTGVRGASITNHCIGADNMRILFFSQDSNLVPGDTNGCQDAFVRDLATGRTFTLTTNASGGLQPTNSAIHGVLSANSRFALLGLVPAPRGEVSLNLSATILRKDLHTGETLAVVSNLVPNNYSFPTPIAAMAFSISADGRWITYPSNNVIIVADMQSGIQTNLTPADPNWNEPRISSQGRYVLYVKRNPRTLAITDLFTGERITLTNVYTGGAVFTQNGEFIVYGTAVGQTTAINLYSIADRIETLICTNCWNPQPSTDARYIAYQTISTPYQIEVKDLETGQTTPVTRSVAGSGGANRDATSPVLSADGRFIAYTTKATNITTDPPNGWNNLHVYDRLQRATMRITGSRSNTGYGSGSSSQPVLGPDARTLVFQSFASDFVGNDFNDTRDIFLLKLNEGDSDNDGMSDDWEQTHFSTTDRDGSGDFDQDGSTDLAEYLAGTNPADGQSVLEVLQITSVNTGQRQLIWRAQSGKSYRVEYKAELAGTAWTSLGQVITATAPTASTIDTTAGGPEKRFYRVTLVQ